LNKHRHTYAIDLLATDSAVAHRALAGDPILIYPKGTHHRYVPWTGQTRTWTVDDATVAQLADNYTECGRRQAHLPVNEDHQGSRALGWFKDVVALPEGLGDAFLWNRKGREALENGEFSYFSEARCFSLPRFMTKCLTASPVKPCTTRSPGAR